jgi:hypothetical protein
MEEAAAKHGTAKKRNSDQRNLTKCKIKTKVSKK